MTEQGRFPGCVLAVLLRNSGVSRSSRFAGLAGDVRMSCTHGLTVRAVREMEPGVLYQPGGGCGCHDSGRNQASVAVMVRSPVSVPAHTPSVRFQRMPFARNESMP